MQRVLRCGAATIAALGVFSSAAAASGPAPPCKDIINLNCVGVGPVTVSVPRSDRNNGAGQLVGEKGFGIPVTFTSTITDLTTQTVVGGDSSQVGGGHGHPNQETTNCSGVLFTGPASVFFGPGPLPPGVAATDTIQLFISGDVIAKQI
jgi:hypothetical protein